MKRSDRSPNPEFAPVTPSWNQWAATYTAWGRKRVRRTDRLGVERLEDRVTPATPGGVTVAVGDLDGDRFPDLIAAGGPGRRAARAGVGRH